MFGFWTVQAIFVAADGYCIGLLLSFLIPADPATLPRVVAWLQANKDPKAGSSIPLRHYRWGVSLMAVVVLVYTQVLMVSHQALFPPWAPQYGAAPLLGFIGVDVLLLIWAAVLIWTFRRAQVRTK